MNPSPLRIEHTIVRRRRAAFLFITLLLAITGIFPEAARGAVTEAWVHRYRNEVSNQTAEGVKAVFDSAANVIVIGDVQQTGFIVVIKYSGADGSVSWRQRYRSAGSYKFDQVKDVGVDGHNNVFILGRSYEGQGGPSDYFTLKLAATDGALLWERRNRGTMGNHDFPQALAVDGAGNVAVMVPSAGMEGSLSRCTVAKYSADGALLWEDCNNGSANRPLEPAVIAVDSSGNVNVTGSAYNPLSEDLEYYTAKYAAADGTLLWEQRYNNPADKLAVDSDGNVVVTGSSGTIKYLANGTAAWTNSVGTNVWINTVVQGIALAVDGSGNVIVTGEYFDGISRDNRTIKYAASDGTVVWERIYNEEHDGGETTAVAVDGNGNVVVTGISYGDFFSGTSDDYYTVKYAAADGELLWEQSYNGPANSFDIPLSVAVDVGGNVVVTGRSSDESDINNIVTVKYAASDGALHWDKRYVGTAVYTTFAKAVAIDAFGNVNVTGSAYNPVSEDLEYYTAKYAAVNGALLWEQRYNDSADDEATAVVVDASGNVVVTGYTAASGGHDFYTAKYAAADGHLLWEKRYNGPANRFDFARALTVDASGNVVVAGDSWNGTNGDILVIKYAADHGSVLWERRYSGPATDPEHDDRAIAVAVDGNGDIIIVGQSETAAGEEYYTAKHAGADGTLLWERRHNNPDAYDEPASLAVDGVGNVIVSGNSGTIKYLADGTGSWTNTAILGNSLSVDANGNVVVAGSSYDRV